MHLLRLMVAVVIVLVLAGCGSGEDPVMPDVTGQRLDVALSDIERAGFGDEVDVVGGGLFGVVDESNWEVCEQLPTAGQGVTSAPRLTVDRSCGEDDSEPSETPSDATAQEPEESESTEPEAAETLTVANNKDLAALLTSPENCGPRVKRFATKYQGRTIEFDGNIAAMANHGDYQTRYDILVTAGDYSETTSSGPSFQFRDVNIVSDLNLTGKNIPDAIGPGDNLHLVAEVDDYNSNSCLFQLEPVSTRFR